MAIQERRSALKGLLAGALSPLLPGCVTPPAVPGNIASGDYSRVVEHMQGRIEHAMKAQVLTGLSIALINDQSVIWTQGFGWADQSAGRAASSETLYRAGSITKLFTVAAALQFAERGRLDLDAPIQRVLPEFRVASRFGDAVITPRQLMTHHAGLPRDLWRGMWGIPGDGFKEALDYLAENELSYPPGQVFSYANLGLSVLGAMVERMAGIPFAEHMQRALFDPLGMKTASISSLQPNNARMSKAYADGEESPEPALRDIAAGGLNANVGDLGRWLMMIFAQGRRGKQVVLHEATIDEMLYPQNQAVSLDLDHKIGLGWQLSPLGGQPLQGGGIMASHAGATINHRCLLVALPQHRLGVAIMCNSAHASTLDQLARTTLALALEAKTGIRQPDEMFPSDWIAQTLPAKALADYIGDYVTPAGLVRVTADDHHLRARITGDRFDLIPDQHGGLHIRKKILGFIPLPLGDLEQLSFKPKQLAGRHVLVARRGQLSMLFGERISPKMHDGWREMLGVYQPDIGAGEFQLIDRLTLFESENALSIRVALRPPLGSEQSGTLLVQTLSEHQALICERLAGCGECLSIRTLNGTKTLELTGYTFRRVTT